MALTLGALALLFAGVVFAGWRWGGLGRAGALPLAAAGTLALAGYAWSGEPALPASPARAAPERTADIAELMALRDRLGQGGFGTDRSWIVFADGSERRGYTERAVAILRRGLRDYSKSVDLHSALAFALIAHADGSVTPAADLALQRVRALDPAAPAPDFVAGEEAARAERYDEARAIWSRLLARAPPGARWASDVVVRLELLRRIGAQTEN